MRYVLFESPEKVSTGIYAWASGLWRFLTPVAYELNPYAGLPDNHDAVHQPGVAYEGFAPSTFFMEVNSPKDSQFYVHWESMFHSPAPKSWLIGDFQATQGNSLITPWTSGAAGGLRGVLKSYFGSDC